MNGAWLQGIFYNYCIIVSFYTFLWYQSIISGWASLFSCILLCDILGTFSLENSEKKLQGKYQFSYIIVKGSLHLDMNEYILRLNNKIWKKYDIKKIHKYD